MTPMKLDENLVTPAYNEIKWRPYYKIHFDLVMIVNGRDLRYEARYNDHRVGEGRQMSIAAAFEPGVE